MADGRTRLAHFSFVLTLALIAVGCSDNDATNGGAADIPSSPSNPPIEGLLTEGGVECPAMTGTDGTLYTLLGDLRGFRVGDRVCIVPSYVEVSYCMQGTTIQVEWIGPAPCPAG